MKKLILIFVAVLLAQFLLAQPGKGKKFIGGSVGTIQTSTPSLFSNSVFDKRSSIDVSPNVGYFINDKIALGISLDYGYYKYSNQNRLTSGAAVLGVDGASYGGSFFARYYKSVTEKLFFTLQGNLSYSNAISNTEMYYNDAINGSYTINQKEIRNNYSLGINPGFEYFISPHLGLNTNIGSLSYSIVNSNNQSTKQSTNAFNINLFPLKFSDLSIGFKYYFQSKNASISKEK